MKKKNIKLTNEKMVANFLYEVGVLAKTPRSGFFLLGTGGQSVAEHTNRAVFIAYSLALMDGKVDVLKVLKMTLFHDISETRISDLNHIHQKYAERKEHNAIEDITNSIPFGNDMLQILSEYEKRESREAILVKDSDSLEWIMSLKEELDKGNKRAKDWIKRAMDKLKTKDAKAIAKEIMLTDSNEWFFPENSVIRSKKYL